MGNGEDFGDRISVFFSAQFRHVVYMSREFFIKVIHLECDPHFLWLVFLESQLILLITERVTG